jgi:hypothetical protein
MISARNQAAGLLRVLLVLDVLTFALASLGHLGVAIPVGFTVLAEAPIVSAAIVEGLDAAVLAMTAYAVFAGRSWAWSAALITQLFALATVAFGMWALAAGLGPRSDLNDVYHRMMLALLSLGLVLLLLPGVRGSAKSPTERA